MFVQLNFLKKRNEDYWTIKTGLTEVHNMKINTVKKNFNGIKENDRHRKQAKEEKITK